MRIVTSVALAVLAAGCGAEERISAPTCENPSFLRAGLGVADFRQRLEIQARLAPPDSTLQVALTFVEEPTAADLALIGQHGGRISYAFSGAPTLLVDFTARALVSYVRAEPGRLRDASLGLRVCQA